MPLIAAPAHGVRESVIPDYCNTGVLFRALVAINAAVLLAILLRASAWQSGLQAFVEASILVEAAALASMFALCALRSALSALSSSVQRTFSVAVPAALTFGLSYTLQPLLLLAIGTPEFFAMKTAIAAGVFGGVLQHYFELRTRASSPALAEARLQALQARIRPHFLFNSLNAVLALIRSEPRKAEATLEDLADLFRVLIRDARDLTSLAQEVQLCEQYLSIEQVRLGERLMVQWDFSGMSDEALHKAQVPALLLQPLLENAVHHGIEPAQEAGLIRIKVARMLDRIEITIINPYRGVAASSGNHMALNNVRERLALLYDVEGQLVTEVSAGTFQVRLRFPYRKTG